MNRKIIFCALALAFFCLEEKSFAQGTAFSYQGRLNTNGVAATGLFDFRFQLFDATNNGNAIGFPQTNAPTPVASGMFNVILDFGPIFAGSNYWLSIGVRTNGATSAYTVLSPRQPVLPVPYAIFATTASNLLGSLSATQLAGALPSAQIAGNYFNSVNFTNATNSFNGKFIGNGIFLTNLNASMLSTGTVADARLTTNVALLNGSQTFSGTNHLTNNANIFNGAFTGSFFGNGLVGWIPVSLTATQAMRDAGYLLLGAGLTTVTLPPMNQLFTGDIVRVSGGGPGGWLVAENSGEFILGGFASYRSSSVVPLASSGDYQAVAASADGALMFRVGNTVTGVEASSNSGRTWNRIGDNYITGAWASIACSANGKIIFIGPVGGGAIKTSVDGGLTWANSAFTSSTSFISCSADGSKVFTSSTACSGNGNYLARLIGGVISVSTNAGAGWFNVASAPTSGVTCLAASSDCTRLVAGVNNGLLYASANQGVSWTALTSTNQFWSDAWISPDGAKIAASVNKFNSIEGGIFYSSTVPLPNVISTNSTICGSQGSAVELQYTGNGQFIPVSFSGLLWAN